MSRIGRRAIATLLVFFGWHAQASEDASGCSSRGGDFSWENDGQFWALRTDTTDHFYTNGMRLRWWTSREAEGQRDTARRSGDQKSDGDGFLSRGGFHLANLAASVMGKDQVGACNGAVVEVGHVLYTPTDLRSQRPIIGERPYGSWLWVSVSGVHAKNFYSGPDLSRRLPESVPLIELTFGVTGGVFGQGAGGKFVQTFAHRLLRQFNGRDVPPNPLGWHNQIRNRAVAMGNAGLNIQTKGIAIRRLGRVANASVSPLVSVGTPLTEGQARVTGHLGYNLGSAFWPAQSLAVVGSNGARDLSTGWRPAVPQLSLGFFAGVTGRVTLRNESLDCGVCGLQYRVERIPRTWEWEWGLQARIKGFWVAWRRVNRSADFRSFDSLQKPEGLRFGSWSFAWNRSPKAATNR